MRKLLVTGSSGLIGSALMRALRGAGVKAVGVDRVPGASTDVEHTLLPGDATLARLFGDVTGIVHLAGVSRVVWGQRDPLRCWNANVRMTASIVEAAVSAPLRPWLIYASSREVYGQAAALPVSDDAPVVPVNVYGFSKAAAEALVEQAVKLRGLDAGILRFSTVFGGAEDHSDRVIPAFMFAALRGAPLTVFGTGVRLDPTWIGDAIEGVLRLADALSEGRRPQRPILLSRGVPVGLADLAEQIRGRLGSSSPIIIAPPRCYDVERFAGTAHYAMDFLGWRGRVSLEDGIDAYAELLRRGSAM
jgi:nucleoside-diphosphate-sugar epimerase